MKSSHWESLGFSDDEDLLIDMLIHLRKGDDSFEDEILLHSGGPVTDLSKRSLLPCLESIRILMVEPEGELEEEVPSALDGEVSLGPPSPLNLIIQKREGGKWRTFEELCCSNLTEALDRVSDFEITAECDTDVSFHPGGFTGILGYDLSRWAVPIRLSNTPLPGSVLGVLWRADAWIVHDRNSGEVGVVGLEGHPWLDLKLPKTGGFSIPEKPKSDSVPHSESDSEHAIKVSRVRESIIGGNLYQVNYGRKWKGEMPGHPWDSFLLLSRSNPAPFSSWMMVSDLGWSVASSSPERLVELDLGRVRTRPIKGTSKRGRSDEEDEMLRMEMVSSEKEISEHLMLVDLERHDLSKVCKPGTVHWSGWRIEALSNVQHLVSGVEGEIASDFTTSEVTALMFPGGSVTGCPKTVTLAAIDELEDSPRGAWTGSIGHIHKGHGVADWNILIRTLEAHSGPENWHATVQAGGGIVIGSSPAEEVEEARWKAAAVTESAWGFRTGFSNDDLPERDVSIFPVPLQEGAVSQLRPGRRSTGNKIGTILNYPCDELDRCTLLVDNLDSFTRNIAEVLSSLGSDVVIVEGREITGEPVSKTADEILEKISPDRIILGPGPSRPESYPLTMELAERSVSGDLVIDGKHIPVLGLCLGHQALGLADGWQLVRSPKGPVHGTPSVILSDGTGISRGIPRESIMMRYNSLVLLPRDSSLIPNSWDQTGELVMGITHESLPVDGVQYHPESVGSPNGRELLSEFLSRKPMISDYHIRRQV
jgi:anthranilate synthase/aminodeoxychorismate synthase-like glutamine amidotransferase